MGKGKFTKIKLATLLLVLVGTSFGLAESTKFDRSDVDAQAYWYSRYNLGHLVMRSGMGEQLKPQPEFMRQLMGMANDDVSQVSPAKHPYLLKRVFNSGNPAFANSHDGDNSNFTNFRWKSVSSEPTNFAAFGWTVIKESEWSKQFNVDFHFGSPGDKSGIPGAQQRFAGLVLCMEAMAQIQDFKNNPINYDKGSVGDQYVAIAALANFGQYLRQASSPLMKDNRCAQAVAMKSGMSAQQVGAGILLSAKDLFLKTPLPKTIRDKSLAIQSLAWLAASDSEVALQAKDRLVQISWSLASPELNSAAEKGVFIRAMIEAGRITGIAHFKNLAAELFVSLQQEFDASIGIFSSQDTYTVEDIAGILAGLNALTHFAGGSVDQDQLAVMMTSFFKATVNESGLQISAPPVSMIPEYERKGEIAHRYPTIPMPPMAGGAHGTAPVYAASVTYNRELAQWSAQKDHFDTAGAMHLANEMIWFHRFEVNGFPEVK